MTPRTRQDRRQNQSAGTGASQTGPRRGGCSMTPGTRNRTQQGGENCGPIGNETSKTTPTTWPRRCGSQRCESGEQRKSGWKWTPAGQRRPKERGEGPLPGGGPERSCSKAKRSRNKKGSRGGSGTPDHHPAPPNHRTTTTAWSPRKRHTTGWRASGWERPPIQDPQPATPEPCPGEEHETRNDANQVTWHPGSANPTCRGVCKGD